MNYSSIFKLFALSSFLILFSCNEPGCTDPNAINYNNDANKDDNSCEYLNTINIEFRLVNGNQSVAKYDTIQYEENRFRVENVKFYISDLQLKSSNGNKNLTAVHLFSISDANSHRLSFEVEEGSYEGLNFSLGLNSEQNSTTPADYDVDHPLGINQNTFWAMTPASYIFVMIEGKNDTTLENNFYNLTYHLAHNDLLKNIDLSQSVSITKDNTTTLLVNVDISQIFNDVDFSDDLPHQITASPLAQLLMTNFSNTFELQ